MPRVQDHPRSARQTLSLSTAALEADLRTSGVTFPALLALATDPVIATHPIAQRVYLHVLATLDFSEPRDVKGWLVAEQLKVRAQTVNSSFDTRVERGFLTDHGRSVNNVRRFTLAWAQSGIALQRTTPNGGPVKPA